MSGSLSSVPLAFLSNMFGIVPTLGEKKSSLKHNLKQCVTGQEIKGFNLKGCMERPFYRGKTFEKDCLMKKILDGTQKEIKQETDNFKAKLHLKINIYSEIMKNVKGCAFKA